jgi:hypothetical protein
MYRDVTASAFGRFTLSIGNARLTHRVSGGNAQKRWKIWRISKVPSRALRLRADRERLFFPILIAEYYAQGERSFGGITGKYIHTYSYSCEYMYRSV